MKIYAQVLEFGILSIEKSMQRPMIKNKHQKIKKQLNYNKIQDKLNFNDNLTRFWFILSSQI